jgi:hypothetical protein
MTMATKDDTSKARPSRNCATPDAQSASGPPKPPQAAPSLKHLEGIVEDERSRLMKAHSILSCAVIAMEDEQVCTGEGPYWPSVIESASELIDESMRRLDSLDYSMEPVSRSVNEVREPAMLYGSRMWSGSLGLSTRDGGNAVEEGRPN